MGQDSSLPRTNSFSYCRRIRQAVAIRQPLVVFLQCGKRGTPQEMCEHRRRLRLDKTKTKNRAFSKQRKHSVHLPPLKNQRGIVLIYKQLFTNAKTRKKHRIRRKNIFSFFGFCLTRNEKRRNTNNYLHRPHVSSAKTDKTKPRATKSTFFFYLLNESRIDKSRKMCYYIKTNKYFARDARETYKSVSCKDSNFCMLSGTR